VKVGSKDQQQVGNRRSWEAVLQLVAKIMAVTLSGIRKLLVYIMVTNEDSYRWGHVETRSRCNASVCETCC